MSQRFCTAYTLAPEARKLSELRTRTDRQLLKLIHSKLEVGLSFAALVEDTDSSGNPDHAGPLLRRAEQAVIEVKQLLPVLSEDQRRGFGPTLNNLQAALDRLGRCRERSRSRSASVS
jgi:hypothetical protein